MSGGTGCDPGKRLLTCENTLLWFLAVPAAVL